MTKVIHIDTLPHTAMQQDLQSIWNAVLGELQTEISKPQFLTYVKKTYLLSIVENTATVGAQSNIVINMLKDRFYDAIKKSLDHQVGKETIIVFIPYTPPVEKTDQASPLFDEGLPQPNELIPEAAPSEMTSTEHIAATPMRPSIFTSRPKRVRAEFTFENLAVSTSNQLAFVSAQTVAKNLGKTYNPLFIYGPVGVGKTHLMQAIANEVAKTHGEKNILYITSEEFINEVVDAIRNNQTQGMKKRFRSVELLIIDDVQFIAGKNSMMEELFHTFNILIDNAAQIVLSSDRPPQEIKRLDKRLASRFAAGLTVDVEAPDFELRTAILLIKAKKYGIPLPIESAKLIAQNNLDARTLEGGLLRVITEANTKGVDITDDFVFGLLAKRQTQPNGRLHTDDIIKSVCDFYDIKPTLLKGPKRDASLVKARQIAMYLLKDKMKLTYVEIGNVLGGRDHTTIMHGVGKIEEGIASNAHYAADILGITNLLSEQRVDG